MSTAGIAAITVGSITAGLVALALLAVAMSPGATAPFSDSCGRVVAGSIAELSMLELGGVEQFVLIRGRSAKDPVLLLLHGGPGDAQTALFRYYNAALEDHFVVVNWDQRGAGRSFDPLADPVALSDEQILADAHELTAHLRERFGGRKIVLAGHSWGSYLGMLLAHRHPEDYAAYVGIGQVADQARSEALSYAFVLGRAGEEGQTRALSALRAIGPPDARGHYRGGLAGLGVERRWVREFGGAAHGKGNIGALLTFGLPILACREYRLRDKIRYLDAEARSMAVLEDDLLARNLMQEVDRLALPLFVFQGRYDQQTVTSLTRQFFDEISAPHKEFLVFEQSAHLVPYEEPEQFLRAMVDRVRPWALR